MEDTNNTVSNIKQIQSARKGQRGFTKGISGNPKGKAKGTKHFSTIIRNALINVSEDGGSPEDILIVKTLAKKLKIRNIKNND